MTKQSQPGRHWGVIVAIAVCVTACAANAQVKTWTFPQGSYTANQLGEFISGVAGPGDTIQLDGTSASAQYQCAVPVTKNINLVGTGNALPDDVQIVAGGATNTCLFVNGDFEAGLTGWTTSVGGNATAAVSAGGAISPALQGQVLDMNKQDLTSPTVSLTQRIPLLPQDTAGLVLSFNAYTNDIGLRLAVGVNVGGLPFATSTSPLNLIDGVSLPFPTLKVVVPADVPNADVTVVFSLTGGQGHVIIDDLCLTKRAPATALQVGTGVSVRLENLSVKGGSAGIDIGTGADLELGRCRVQSDTGVDNRGTIFAYSSVFTGCSNAGLEMRSNSKAYIYQSTFIGNSGNAINVGSAVSGAAADVAACIFASNGRDVNAGATGVTWVNNVADAGSPASSGPLAAAVIGTSTPTSTAQLFRNTWDGELKPIYTVTSGLDLATRNTSLPTLSSRLQATGSRSTIDYEGTPRGVCSTGAVQAGADENGGCGGTIWTIAGITLAYESGATLYDTSGGVPAIRADEKLIITLALNGHNVDETVGLYIVPEGLATGVSTEAALRNILTSGSGGFYLGTGPAGSALTTGEFNVTFSDSSAGSLPEPQNVVDGMATVVLLVGGQLFGPTPYGGAAALTNSSNISDTTNSMQFIVDTTPPTFHTDNTGLGATGMQLARPLVGEQPFNTAFASQVPAGWGGLNATATTAPASYGSLGDQFYDPQVFFNAVPTAPMDFAVKVSADDMGPLLSTNAPASVITSGYVGVTPAATDAKVVLYGLDAGGTQVIPEPGTAYWEGYGANSAGNLLLNALATLTQTPLGAVNKVEFEWRITNVSYQAGWHIIARMMVIDRAGNKATSPRPLHVWWLTDPRFQINSSPTGSTASPVFSWGIRRAAQPSHADPCYPIAHFRLWELNPAGTVYSSLDLGDPAFNYWSPYSGDPAITESSVVRRRIAATDPDLTLGDVLRDPALQGKTLGISVTGWDEAANRDTTAADFDLATIPNDNTLADDPHFKSWVNGGASAPVETTLQTDLWYNMVPSPSGSVATVDPVNGEINFGSAARVPLPPPDIAANMRVEAKFKVGTSGNIYQVSWELYEDGRLVATGGYTPSATLDGVQIPEDLYNPGPTGAQLVGPSFLNPRFDANCANSACGPQLNAVCDRLGDDGCEFDYRKRDVTYTFVARAQDVDGNIDTTPATSSFVVTVGTIQKDEQSVKESSFGNP